MPFIFIDRRKAGKGKSTHNRQKLIKRVKGFIKTATPVAIGNNGGVSGANNKSAVNPVKIANSALEEPWFAYAAGGNTQTVFIGNETFQRGDEIHIPDDQDEDGGGGPGENGEDDFTITVASDEFLDMFFEDCELPNLENEKLTEKFDPKQQHSGYSTSGNPAQLSIIRTYKQSIGRRRALTMPYREELVLLQEELKSILDKIAAAAFDVVGVSDDCPKCGDHCHWEQTTQHCTGCGYDAFEAEHARADEIEERIIVLQRKMGSLSTFDKVDLRYRKKESKPLHTVDAVLIMVMDISGSMDQMKKTTARRWFALLYAFIKRRYGAADLIFIAHTEEAFEMTESDFFNTRVNGGTSVSPAIRMVNEIINSRFDPTQTNIYVSHGSDGDNWHIDNDAVVEEMCGAGNLMSKVQYFSYVEVGSSSGYGTNLWDTYESVQNKIGFDKLSMATINRPGDCYSVFQKVFKKK